jgi:hypothetical protein
LIPNSSTESCNRHGSIVIDHRSNPALICRGQIIRT